MKIKNKNKILNFIKYGPIIFVTIIFIVISQIFIFNEERKFNIEKKELEKNYLALNKKKIKEEVQRVYNLIENEKNSAEIQLKKMIKNRVYEAYNVAHNIYNQEFKREPKQEIFNLIKTTLGSIIYNKGRGYYFIDNEKGIGLLQPLNKDLEGKNKLEYTDAKGYQFVKTIVKTIKNKTERYDSYYWYKSNNKINSYKKISFYKYFEPYNVIIGTGEYVDDFEDELKEKILEIIKNIRYGTNGYIYIFNYKGDVLAHYEKELIGKNIFKQKKQDAKLLVRKILDFSKKNKSGYLPYASLSKINNIKKGAHKIAYIKEFKDWGWVIGSGFYLEQLNKEIAQKKKQLEIEKNKRVKEIFIVSLLIGGIFILIAFFVARILDRQFHKYEGNIKQYLHSIFEKEKVILKQSKMIAMVDMISNIAHQWRQPLSAISTLASGIKVEKEFNTLTLEKIEDRMDDIVNHTKQLSRTIETFRGFLNEGKTYKEIVVQDNINDALEIVNGTLKESFIEVEKNYLKQKELKINCISGELTEVLINIINNSKDAFMERDIEKRVIKIDLQEQKDSVLIIIEDNAGGVPKEILDRIFEPYFTTKYQRQGIGLGLYICYKILKDSLKGNIEVENIKDGIKFTIKLRKSISMVEVSSLESI